MMNVRFNTLLALAALMAVGITDAAEAQPTQVRSKAKGVLAPLPAIMPGADKDSPALVALGRRLFFEKRLSVNNSQSCNSCHAVDKNSPGVDNQPTSLGAFGKRGGRNSPTVLNAGLHVAQFWDGRAAKLEDQAKGPILNPGEMAMPSDTEVVNRLKSFPEYGSLFAKAFPESKDAITYDNLARAIAAFERTLVTRDRFDDFLKGDDKALSALEQRGLETFLQLGCTTCHNGPAIGGNSYQKVGLVNPYPHGKDEGRFAVTKDEDDKGKMKVPSLRNIALTHPYFHDGAVTQLGEAVRDMGWMQLGLKLNQDQVDSLVAFLNTLSDKERAKFTKKPAAK